jgi:hypothetical protein
MKSGEWFQLGCEDFESRQFQTDASMHRLIFDGRVCATCSAPRESLVDPIDVVFNRSPTSLLVPTRFVCVIRREVFDVLKIHLRGCNVGKCILESGDGGERVLDEYVSCYTSREASLRLHGTAKARFSVCNVCGFIDMIYSGGDDPYAVESDLDGRLAYQVNVNNLFVVHTTVLSRIPRGAIRGAELVPVPILERALDLDARPGGSRPNVVYRD